MTPGKGRQRSEHSTHLCWSDWLPSRGGPHAVGQVVTGR